MDWKKWGAMISLLLIVWVWQEWPEERLRVVFCDVGQGDGAIIVLGTFQAIVDTGAYPDKMSECLSEHIPFWDSEIELVFISHGDKDHAGALERVTKHYKVGRLVDKPFAGDIVRYGSLSFDILKGVEPVGSLQPSKKNDSNETSVVMKLSYGEFSVLFTGDIGLATELSLLGEGVLGKIDVLKVPHHGSKNSSGLEFLKALSPEVAVISVGEKNSYGHPHGDTLSRLDVVGANVLRTDRGGSIEFKTDGENLEIFRASY